MAKLSKEEWGQLKDLPFLGYLDYRGIEYQKKTSTYYNLVEHDSLVIDMKKNMFVWNSRNVIGDLGKFIATYENVNNGEALARWAEYAKYSAGLDFDIKKKYAFKAEDNYVFDWKKIKKSNNYENAKKYLVTERGLDSKFVERLFKNKIIYSGKKYKDSTTGAILNEPIYFPWKNQNGEIKGADRQGTTINFKKFSKRGTEKRISRGSDSDYGFNLSFGTGADKLIIVESPIDALSYIQQNMHKMVKDNATIFSTSGTDYLKVGSQLARMREVNGKIPQIVVATDNDLAGFNMADHFQFENTIREVPIEGKDWNDQLKTGKSGIKTMTMEENTENCRILSAINDWDIDEDIEASRGGEDKTKKFEAKDESQILSGTPKSAKKYKNKAERALENRKENEEIIKKAVKNISDFQSDSKKVKNYLDFIANNSKFSTRNSLLIFSQNENASNLKGIREWKEQGAFIKKGEKGIRVFGAAQTVPFVVLDNGTKIRQQEATEEQLKLVSQNRLKLKDYKYYPVITLFDISQTTVDKKQAELQDNTEVKYKLSDLSVDQANVAYKSLSEQAKNIGFKVVDKNNQDIFVDRDTEVNSVLAEKKDGSQQQLIFVKEGLEIHDKVKTLADSLGEASLYNATKESELNVSTEKDVKQDLNEKLKSMQTKMTSYTILKHMGVEPDGLDNQLKDWNKVMKNVNDKKGEVLAQVTQASKVVTRNLDQKLSENAKQSTVVRQLSNENKNIKQQNNQVLMDEANDMKSTGRGRK